MYITGSRAHFFHLPDLGQAGHSQGEPLRVLGPWTWIQCGLAPSPPATTYLTNPKPDKVDILSHGWLGGQLQLKSWLAG